MHENPAGGCYNVTLFFKAGLRLRIRWDPNTITGSVCAYNWLDILRPTALWNPSLNFQSFSLAVPFIIEPVMRRIKTKEKAKVVAAAWGAELRNDMKNRMNSIPFFKLSWSSFAFSSVFILLLHMVVTDLNVSGARLWMRSRSLPAGESWSRRQQKSSTLARRPAISQPDTWDRPSRPGQLFRHTCTHSWAPLTAKVTSVNR